jgi:hypothetical protein
MNTLLICFAVWLALQIPAAIMLGKLLKRRSREQSTPAE